MSDLKYIVVTGGAGFIGSHIAARLLAEGRKVTILDNLSTGEKSNIPRGADFIHADLGLEKDFPLWQGLTCDAVLHLAGQPSGEASFLEPLYDLRSHVMSTFFLVNWCLKKKVRRFLYSSSMSVYGDPQLLPVKEEHRVYPKTFYGAGKASAEAYLKLQQTLGVNTTIFRLFSVYGPGQDFENKMQGMASIFLSYMLEGLPIKVKGAKDRCRDFVYVDDVVDAWHMALENPMSYGKTYNVGGGKAVTVEKLLESLRSAFGNPAYPIDYLECGTPGDQFGMEADIGLIISELGWRPRVVLEEGLARMIASARGEWVYGA